MRRLILLNVFAALAAVALAAMAAAAPAATIWDVTKLPLGPVVGHVTKSSTKTFAVTDAASTAVGKVVKKSGGAWNVMRSGKKIAVVKSNGSKKYPVNLYNLKGKRIGRAGLKGDVWWVYKVQRIAGTDSYLNEILASLPKACPGRAAAGAVRLVYWK
jgi:hypothetical protein